MRWLARMEAIFRAMFRRGRSEADLDAELLYHFEKEVESGVGAGMTPAEARLAAQRQFGPDTLYKEECRDARGIGLFETVARDLRYALRTLRRTPLFTVVAIVTLALGIGANTTVFTFIENILLRSLPVHDPQTLVAPNWGTTLSISYPNYVDFRDRNEVFSSLVAYRFAAASIGLQARESLRVWGYQATGNYFETLGVEPLMGRFFSQADDDKTGAHPVLVISHRLWQSRFAADPNVVGRTVKVNGFPFTIIGVARPGFSGTEIIIAGDYWVPLSMQTQIEPGSDFMRYRTSQNLFSIARLKPGVSRARAEANLDQIAQQLAHTYPDDVNPKDRFHLSSPGLVGADLRGPVTKFSVLLMGIAGAGLLLACANLAGMLLARASDRHREIGIRLALGASRVQLVRQLLAESMVLAVGGGMVGLAIAFAACDFLSSWHPAFGFPISATVRPNTTVLLFTLAVALGTTLLSGLTPALQAIRTDLVPSLKNEPVSTRFRSWSARDLLVVVQIALSMILVISSVLVVRSLQHALSLNLGFNPQGAVSVSFDLSLQRYDTTRSRRFDADLLEKASRLPGFDFVGAVNDLPLRTGGFDSEFVSRVDRPVPPPAERRVALIYNISPGYLQAAGTKLLRGRDVNGYDRDGQQPVALVNDATARLLFGKDDPLGKHIRLTASATDPGVVIVGVVETGKYLSLGEDPFPAVFLPIAQSGTGWTTLVARTRLPAQAAAGILRSAVLDLDPELTVFSAGSLKDELALPLFPARIVSIVLGIFGVLAIVLAATGLFALVAYAVSRRSREIGIRMALGARPGEVLFSVLKRTVVLCGVGMVLGTVAALATGRLLSSVLYGISPRDPVTYLSGVLVLTGVALIACWNPAMRAIRIDPARILRGD
jgi:predicted permease